MPLKRSCHCLSNVACFQWAIQLPSCFIKSYRACVTVAWRVSAHLWQGLVVKVNISGQDNPSPTGAAILRHTNWHDRLCIDRLNLCPLWWRTTVAEVWCFIAKFQKLLHFIMELLHWNIMPNKAIAIETILYLPNSIGHILIDLKMR